MAEGLPRYELLAESLHGLRSEFQRVVRIRSTTMTHASNLLYVGVSVGPQHLDCDIPPLIYALAHIPEPTTVQRDARWIVAQLNL